MHIYFSVFEFLTHFTCTSYLLRDFDFFCMSPNLQNFNLQNLICSRVRRLRLWFGSILVQVIGNTKWRNWHIFLSSFSLVFRFETGCSIQTANDFTLSVQHVFWPRVVLQGGKVKNILCSIFMLVVIVLLLANIYCVRIFCNFCCARQYQFGLIILIQSWLLLVVMFFFCSVL